MPTEGATHISNLNNTLPVGSVDQVLIVDNHLRMIKEVMQRDVNGFVGSALIFGESTHSSNVYPVSLAVSPSTYEKGMIVIIKALNANTGAVDINVASLGAKNLFYRDGTELVSGYVKIGSIIIAVYDGTNFILVSDLISASEAYADAVAAAEGNSAAAASIPLIDPFVENNAVLQDNAGGVKDAGEPLVVVTEVLSGRLTISEGASYTIGHALGTTMPSSVMIWLECLTTDSSTGHTAGQFVLYKSGGGFNNADAETAPSGVQVTFDATNMYVDISSHFIIMSLLHFGTGAAAYIANANAAKWAVHVNAFVYSALVP